MLPDAAQAGAQHLHFAREDDLKATGNLVLAATTAWCADWNIDGTRVSVQCRSAVRTDSETNWMRLFGDRIIFVDISPDFRKYIAQCLLGGEVIVPVAASSVVHGLARSAEQGLMAGWTAALASRAQTADFPDETTGWSRAPDAWFARYSGAMVINVHIDARCTLHCLIRSNAVPVRMTNRAKDFTSLAAALLDVPVRLNLLAGEVRASVGELSSVEVGSVLRLTSRVDQPMPVCVEMGAQIFSAFVGLQLQAPAMRVMSLENQTN
jgi:flagellar motor switch/type III secretory pathway protein FliN